MRRIKFEKFEDDPETHGDKKLIFIDVLENLIVLGVITEEIKIFKRKNLSSLPITLNDNFLSAPSSKPPLPPQGSSSKSLFSLKIRKSQTHIPISFKKSDKE